MAENLKQLKRRIKTVKNTKHITSAMEMVSASKLRKTQLLLAESGHYVKKLEEILRNLSSSSQFCNHPFLKLESGQLPNIIVIYSSDRGLCGSFNNQMIKFAENELNKIKSQNKEIELILIGKKAITYFGKKNQYKIVERIENLNGKANLELSDRLTQEFTKKILQKEIDSVYLIFCNFVSKVKCYPQISQLLPLKQEEIEQKIEQGTKLKREYLTEPSGRIILDHLLPEYINTKFFQVMLSQFASEHSARMMSMNNASKNCHELIDSLTLVANKARQASITRELIDIIGGVVAVN